VSIKGRLKLDHMLSFRASPDIVAAVDAYALRLAERGPEYPVNTAAALRGLVVRGIEDLKRTDADEAA
jgi:hypothetical protein